MKVCAKFLLSPKKDIAEKNRISGQHCIVYRIKKQKGWTKQIHNSLNLNIHKNLLSLLPKQKKADFFFLITKEETKS